ncbi:MAG: amidase family protein, partial [Vagococcus sp.]
AASKMLYNFVPPYDATVMTKVYENGMIPVGKLNMDEFAMGSGTETSYFKKTVNPWNETKVPGGSSGGSAASVASGQVPVSLGSDTGGSIRQPASYTGIVGMKPTYGRISRYGLIAFASSLDQIGPMTRTVEDNALVLNAVSGHDVKDGTSSKQVIPDFSSLIGQDIKGMKIGVPKEFMSEGVDSEVRKSIEEAIETLRHLGATVEEVSLPHSKYGVQVYYIIASSEASSNLQRFDGIRYGYRSENITNLEDVYVNSRSEGF